MTDRPMFEVELERRLRARADKGIRPFDPDRVAAEAIRARRRARAPRGRAWLAVAAMLLLGGSVAFALGPAGVAPPSPVLPPGNGLIAISTLDHTASMRGEARFFVVGDGATDRWRGGADDHVTCPAFSADGGFLARLMDGELTISRVAVIAGDDQRIPSTSIDIAWQRVCPVWDPTRSRLAVLSQDGILVRSLEEPAMVLPRPDKDIAPFARRALAWRADGTVIALATGGGIHLIPLDAAPSRRIHSAVALDIAWSPDGTRLAFSTEGNGATGRMFLLDVSVDGDEEPRAVELGPGSRASWSWDGRLAYRGLNGIVILDTVDAEPRVVGHATAYGFGGWSPDGRRLLQMLDTTGMAWSLLSVDAETGSWEVVPGAEDIPTGSARNFPDLGDVSWQPIYPDPD